ncbi:splicing factor, proline- and glutamine-rich-like [Triticum dicoccoides]|uniref:splicing factor, proline- and glutamine-rich-like n=1 Tax=Triticum dicoccoides TaxID=85692 RepID=UPI0018905CCF|nr:splicing factor, proline- and glutamine-rich-like [Triticum dicoccoides]
MERDGSGPALAVALVCLLCCLAAGASAAYSVPADPRVTSYIYFHGPAPAASPRRHHHRQHSVVSPAPAPHHAPSPTAGADGLPPSRPPAPVYTRAPEPHFGFPLEPTVGVSAGGPSGALPKKGDGEGYPFVGSNPTVPLPTGVTDTATVRPLPDTANNDDNAKVAGRAAEPLRAGAGAAMIGLLMAVLSTVALLLSSRS